MGPQYFQSQLGSIRWLFLYETKWKKEREGRESEVPLTLTQSGKGAHEGRSSSVGFVNPAAEFTLVLRGSIFLFYNKSANKLWGRNSVILFLGLKFCYFCGLLLFGITTDEALATLAREVGFGTTTIIAPTCAYCFSFWHIHVAYADCTSALLHFESSRC